MLFKEFLQFLKNYGVIGLAVAIVLGTKLNELVKVMVDNLLMPFVGMVLPSGDWRQLGFEINGAKFGVGNVLGASIDFLIVAGFVFAIAKYILREEVVSKK
jgi:large conductance mechanosensitive channel